VVWCWRATNASYRGVTGHLGSHALYYPDFWPGPSYWASLSQLEPSLSPRWGSFSGNLTTLRILSLNVPSYWAFWNMISFSVTHLGAFGDDYWLARPSWRKQRHGVQLNFNLHDSLCKAFASWPKLTLRCLWAFTTLTAFTE
jgi:hypothetical protein